MRERNQSKQKGFISLNQFGLVTTCLPALFAEILLFTCPDDQISYSDSAQRIYYDRKHKYHTKVADFFYHYS